MAKHKQVLAIAGTVLVLLAGSLSWWAIRAPAAPFRAKCASVGACEHLAQRVFGRDVLMPDKAALVDGVMGHERLGMDFRLTEGDFRVTVSAAPVRCSARRIALTGLRFCYTQAGNGFIVVFRHDDLTYILSMVQDIYDTAVPRLAQAMTVVGSYGSD